MKNKEIEELLNKAKDIAEYGADGKQHTRMFNQFEAKALLSYIEQLEEENKYLKQLCETQNNREYRSKFLKEFQKENGENVFPDYDEIYKRYDNLKEDFKRHIDRINELTERNDKLQQENQQLKKQKDDVVEYIKSLRIFSARNNGKTLFAKILNEILRMLGEIDA